MLKPANSKKDSGQAGMRKVGHSIAGLVIALLICAGMASIAYGSSAPANYIPNSFESPLFSGYFDYDYKINVPPGTDGLAPKLSISYNNHAGRRAAGWVGAGWEIPVSYIRRNTDGTFDLILDGARSPLVYSTVDNRYHTKIESYLKIEKKTGAPNDKGDYWTLLTKDGTEYRFGYNLDSENMDSTNQFVWRWSLDRIKDSNGNCIYFTYAENPTPNDIGAVYLSKIEYNTEKKRLIEFFLEDTDRPDIVSTVDQGSTIQLARRLREIGVSIFDQNGQKQLVKSFQLQYSLNPDMNKSLLTSITRYAGDGSSLPPVTFEYTVYSDAGGNADLLSRITNELGGFTAMTYISSSTCPNTSLPYNYWLVAAITADNGMTGPHALSSSTTFAYENGVYDLPTDEFRGFGKVTETRPDTSKVVHTFLQDDARKGKEAKVEIFDGQIPPNPYHTVENTWTIPDPQPVVGVYIVRLERSDEYTYDGTLANPRIESTEYRDFDDYGNVRLTVNQGDTAVTGDELYTYKEFIYNPDLWIVDKVKHSYVSATEGGLKLRERWFYYDGAFNPDTQPPFEGNLTKEEHWNNTGSNPVTYYQYDSYGNLVWTADPAGHDTQVDYDEDYRTFPIRIYNAKNQLTTKEFNAATGQLISETDPNGNTTNYIYDTFNRLIKAIKPYDSETYPTVEMQYLINSASPHRIIAKLRETSGGSTFDSVKFVDGAGKLIQSKAEYEDPSKNITADVFYDMMGRDYKHSNPYLTAYSLDYSTPDINVHAAVSDFDPVGRQKKITNPDDTFRTTTYDHWQVTETDENGHSKTQVFDANSKLVQVIERNGAESYTTNYQYNPVGKLIRTTDHNNNTWTNEYDSLGRKNRILERKYNAIDDLVQVVFTYDLVGNMLSQTDARSITIHFKYDALNRKTLIDYPNDNDVQFVYDLNTKGTLSQITDSLGTVSFKYDQRLRKIQEDRSMDGLTWTTKWSYDSMDRIATQTYPDGQVVTFNYTPQGELGSIPGIISNMNYDVNGQVTKRNYANGKETTYTYHPYNHLLTGISTPGIQGFSYTYDNVGNVKTIADSILGRTETFVYDDLNRLTRAYDNLATGGYDTGYIYNAIGNMLSETNNKDSSVTQYTYGEGSAKPHAVTGKTDKFPIVGSFVIDNGTAYCTLRQVALNNISMGYPTEYMASEDANFTGASWQPFSTSPVFTLSPSFGIKKVYFKVRNGNGESKVKSAEIEFLLDSDGDGIPDKYDDDNDNDGIPDSWEIAQGLNPFDPSDASLDPDGDGLTNLQEYQNNTNPHVADSDGDGWTDYQEVIVHHSDPNKADTDNDGLTDPIDPNPRNPYNDGFSENYSVKRWVFNAGGNVFRISTIYAANDRLGSGFSKSPLTDTDGDGIPDSWEIAHGMNPADPTDALGDPDGDGLTNLQEYMRGTEPNKADTDNDGWTDYQEIYLYHTDPTKPDTDGDGLIDSQDPNPAGQYNPYLVSENYSIRRGGFNAGGSRRAGTIYDVSDKIAGDLNGNVTNGISLSISPDSVHFDNAVVENPSVAVLTVFNKGLDNLVMGSMTLTGDDAIEFSVQNDNCSNKIISPSLTCTVQVRLLPKSVGSKEAILNIPYNDSQIKYAAVSLTGIAAFDTAPPDTIITAMPSDPSIDDSASFGFTSTEPNSTFQCKMDNGNYSACTSPLNYTGLADGSHTFSVKATDEASNTDPTPAVYTWTITKMFAITFSVIGGNGAISCAPASVPFGGNFQCTLSPLSGYCLQSLIDNASDVTSLITDNAYSVSNVMADHIINATFQQNPPVKRISRSSAQFHSSIQSAYNASSGGDIIQSQAVSFYENLIFNRNISIIIEGGCSSDFASEIGYTTINGTMTISNGTVIVEDLILR